METLHPNFKTQGFRDEDFEPEMIPLLNESEKMRTELVRREASSLTEGLVKLDDEKLCTLTLFRKCCGKVRDTPKRESLLGNANYPRYRNVITGYSILSKKVPFTMQAIRYNIVSSLSLEGFNWNNVVVAGGAALNAIRDMHSKARDVDIFIYDLDEAGISNKIREILNFFGRRYFKVTKYTVSFKVVELEFQIVLRKFKTITEILYGFDLDPCQVAFDGDNVWLTPACLWSIQHMTLIPNLLGVSNSFESRLLKYNRKGFDIYIPAIKRCTLVNSNLLNIDKSIFPNSIKEDTEALSKPLAHTLSRVLYSKYKIVTPDSEKDTSDYEPNNPELVHKVVHNRVSYSYYKAGDYGFLEVNFRTNPEFIQSENSNHLFVINQEVINEFADKGIELPEYVKEVRLLPQTHTQRLSISNHKQDIEHMKDWYEGRFIRLDM